MSAAAGSAPAPEPARTPGWARSLALLPLTPGWGALCARDPDLDLATAAAVLEEGARFAAGRIAPLNAPSDRIGCTLEGGRVRTPPGFADVYAEMGRDGWLGIDLPANLGGQGLPLVLHAAASVGFDGAAMAFMMASGSSRAAAHMLVQVAPDLAAEWVPRLAAGDWAATICISEPDAGSDVGRIRTRAERGPDGCWRVTGTKCWISFGDHDMAGRIGHCLLARTGPGIGTRGLSLFLVADQLDDGRRNRISVTRLEEKMGLHGSPTCVMAFDSAEAILLGEEGRGLPQLFAMIERMRLQTACQGLGIAETALDIARAYAETRLQGGDPAAPPLPILRHVDVRRQLLAIAAPTEALRALILELATMDDPALAGFLLPLAKNFGAETAFAAASGAMQVLGGAGYTREWPVEQLLRDSRVIAIYEGTTGMQAQDFLLRRLLRDRGAALAAFRARALPEIARADPAARSTAETVIARFIALSERLLADDAGAERAADGYLRAGWHAVCAWMACRLVSAEDADLNAAGRFLLHVLPARMAEAENLCTLPDWI
ncbi:acyl-CoA dehydrogenase family protein [Plastorhodobacter daqingensis]|uniref:Acyl-CoA dehydrogenase family protein n=1 Tax=Plastorhodobacter daqingensis TaxID=1387281 RepID=A0ABW2ULT6_9RHOB